MINPDGSIETAGLKQRHEDVKTITYPVEGIVLDTYYIDESLNREGETQLCDVYVIEEGIYLQRVPVLLPKAGADSYIDFRINPHTKNLDKSIFHKGKPDPRYGNGDSVIIQFLSGRISRPVIMGSNPHNQSGFDGMCPDPREGVDSGDHLKIRIGGTGFKIDKEGNVSFYNIKALDDSIPDKKEFKIDFKEKDKKAAIKFFLSDKERKVGFTLIKEDETAQSFILSESGLTQTVGAYTITATEGVTITGQKGFTLTAKESINMTTDGAGTIKSKGALSVTSDAEATFSGKSATNIGNASGQTKVSGSMVQLADGQMPVARLGSKAVGIGNLGGPVVCTIVDGSPKVSCP